MVTSSFSSSISAMASIGVVLGFVVPEAQLDLGLDGILDGLRQRVGHARPLRREHLVQRPARLARA